MAKKTESEEKKVKLHLPVPIKINDTEYVGTVIVTEDIAATLIHMADLKQRSDASVFTGKNYMIEKAIGNRLVISEAD